MEIRLNNIKKSYENQEVLKGIDLTVGQGDYISIIGRSGCGKTTLLKIIGLLTVPTDGELLIDGKSYSDLWKDELADIRRRNMGFVFQDYLLLEDLSALDNMMLPGLLEKMDGGSSRKRAYELAEYLEIEKELLERYPGEISGGEKQRIAICRALINDPGIIMADEPTGNLDAKSSRRLMDTFDNINKEMGKNIILVTHDPKIARCSDKIFFIDDGVIVKILEKKDEDTSEFYKEILREMEEMEVGSDDYVSIPDYPSPRNPESMEEPVPVGIYLDEAPGIKEHYLFTDETVIVTVLANTEHTENAVKYIDFLFQ